jgi:hypothetical protein
LKVVNRQPITCQIRYELNSGKQNEIEAYACAWISLVERYGGTHHGYFVPRVAPDGIGISFPGVGHDGPSDVAIALFTFPDEESYLRYRENAATDPECRSAETLYRNRHCFKSYERLFLQPVERAASRNDSGTR